MTDNNTVLTTSHFSAGTLSYLEWLDFSPLREHFLETASGYIIETFRLDQSRCDWPILYGIQLCSAFGADDCTLQMVVREKIETLCSSIADNQNAETKRMMSEIWSWYLTEYPIIAT